MLAINAVVKQPTTSGVVKCLKTDTALRSEEEVCAYVREMLLKSAAKEAFIIGKSVLFRAGTFCSVSLDSRKNVLSPYHVGRVDVASDYDSFELTYELSLFQYTIIVLSWAACAPIVLMFVTRHHPFTNEGLHIAFGLCVVGVGLGYVAAFVRFPLWLKTGLKGADPGIAFRRSFNCPPPS